MPTLYDIRPIKKRVSIKPSLPPPDFWQISHKKRRNFWWGILLVVPLILGLYFGFLINKHKTPLSLFLLLRTGRFLVLFQNNAEQRPSGGFIGSFAVVELKNFKIQKYYFETNVHKKDEKFMEKYKIKPPSPYQKVWPDRTMSLANSNFSPDFPTSARDVLWYYNQEYGDFADAVIALNASSFAELLKYTGEIKIPEEELTLNSKNFISKLVYQVERKYFEDPQNRLLNEPKTILKKMIPRILGKMKGLDKKIIFYLAEKNLSEKQAVFYFQNPYKQMLAQNLGWTGQIKESNDDYLYLNNANLGGAKSSLNIKTSIKLDVKQSQKEINSKLEITRTHTGDGNFPDGDNRNYIRILVPKGSKLTTTKLDEKDILKDVEVSEISNKTSFGFWFTVPISKSKTAVLRYKLPNSPKIPYQLLVQKQPGEENTDLDALFNNQRIFSGKLNSDLLIKY